MKNDEHQTISIIIIAGKVLHKCVLYLSDAMYLFAHHEEEKNIKKNTHTYMYTDIVTQSDLCRRKMIA